MKDSDVISAAKDLLDRAGVRPDRADTAARPDGTVFWEEFVQIHRRMTAGTTAETTTTDDADATGKAIS